jgi:hypothetical protein
MVILCPFFLALAFSESVNVTRLGIPLLINIKPYCVLLLAATWRRRQAKEFLVLGVFTISIFALSAFFLDGNSYLLLANFFSFGAVPSNVFTTQGMLSFPSSVSAFTYALRCDAFLRALHVDPHAAAVCFSRAAIDCLKWLSLLFAAGVLALRARNISRESVLVLLVVAITNLGIWVGGYTLVFYIACFPALMRMRQWKAYLALIGLIFLPLDLVPIARMASGVPVQHVFLSSAVTHVSWTLGLGAILRPVLNLALLIALGIEALRTPVAPIREIAAG